MVGVLGFYPVLFNYTGKKLPPPLSTRPLEAGSATASRTTAPLGTQGTATNAGWSGGRDHGPIRRVSLPIPAPTEHPPARQHRIQA